jgi:hypothetical protein
MASETKKQHLLPSYFITNYWIQGASTITICVERELYPSLLENVFSVRPSKVTLEIEKVLNVILLYLSRFLFRSIILSLDKVLKEASSIV